MNKRIVTAAVLTPALLVLAGCSSFGKSDKPTFEYSNTDARANLEVPPELASIPHNDHFTVPSRSSSVSANQVAAYDRASQSIRDDQGHVLQQTTIAQLVRDGQTRYLHVNEPANEVWPVVQDFLTNMGLAIQKEDARTGYIETAWAENRAKLPDDPIRNTLGKILDFAYSTGERDQYRIRLERTEQGTTDVFVTHRSMVEVLVGKEDSSRWEPGPSDPNLEVQMMRQLALAIENEFNPQLKQVIARQGEVPEVEAPASKPELTTQVDKGEVSRLVINQPADRAWRTLNYALDRIGFDVADRNHQNGFVIVNYMDSQYEADVKAKRGFFDRIFRNNVAIDVPQYRIQLVPEGQATQVRVLGAKGEPDTTGADKHILTVLAEEMN